MDDSRRMLEIEDRLAEVELGLAGLRARNDQAVRYLRRELESLAEECRGHRDGWAARTRRAESLLATLQTEGNYY